MAPQLLLECVRRAHAGELWLERRSVGRALEAMLRREANAREVAGLLTPREIEIVRHVAEGLSTKAIAERVGISPGTVKLHLHHIYTKTGVDSRVALLRYAQEKALI
jgi:DNA-binding NarL/FixJ family response regulator